MSLHTITETALINAPAERVYAILADYRNGHPHILPRKYFLSLNVEQGGSGAGTVISFTMRVMGRTQEFRAAVTEPEPGRVLVETNTPNGAVTTFTVQPSGEQQVSSLPHRRADDLRPSAGETQCRLTISTALQTRDGLFGPLERFLTTRALRPIYVEELKLIAARAEGGGRAAGK